MAEVEAMKKLLISLLILTAGVAQGLWVWPELDREAAGEFHNSVHTYRRVGGTLVLGEVVWNGTAATPGTSCLRWLDAQHGKELWRTRLRLRREWEGTVETSYPNALVEEVDARQVVLRFSIARWNRGQKLASGCGVMALSLKDGSELWRSRPVPLDLAPQKTYGLAHGRDLYEFYHQLQTDQIAVLKRGLDNGKQRWLIHVHHRLDPINTELLSARMTAIGLELKCGNKGMPESKVLRVDPKTGRIR